MPRQIRDIQLWAHTQIIGSLSWPISYIVVASLAAFIDLREPSLPILWLMGLIMGGVTALVSGLIVKRQISSVSKWWLVNLVGIPISLTAAYEVLTIESSPAGFVAAGMCSGLIASTAHSISLKRQHSKVGPLISGTFCWTLAFIFGSLLVGQKNGQHFSLMPSDFFTVLLLGWGFTGPLLLLMLIVLSPLSHERASLGPGIRFN